MSTRHPVKPVVVSFALDAVLVVVFAAIGRASHAEDLLAGLWGTAWTFLLALVVAWAVTLAWRAPLAPMRTGIPVWAITVVGGMLLRWASGQGVAFAFIVVATIALFLLIVGWRLIALLVARRSRATA